MRFKIFPRVIRAGAGPHDLGPGERREDAFPELTEWPDAEPESGDEDLGGQWNPTTDGNSPELDIVIHNMQYDEEYDNWDVIADYVFQHSIATSVLLHHGDIARIREVGGEGDISSLLDTHMPRIDVDEGGVGWIKFGGHNFCTQSPSLAKAP
ncbi:hypothetical protein BJ322DRAFT_494463 [Thelephora terrestris]|uniref:Uncharacterized protein n=1 Tax=Thelephora terrestris TaxID=56493 RepID=A0A9P6H4H3_9AGAM|nr:hypothetical protein BJ322DRAFT_494463 [Thelephora terrestris]